MSLFTTLVGGKLLIGALAVGSVAVGGTAAAAATGELPAVLQQQAHSAFGAPAPKVETSTDTASTDATETDSTDATETDSTDATETDSTDATETDSTDSQSTEPTDTKSADTTTTTTTTVAVPASAHGLCTAWSKGGLVATSVAYTTLLTAAGGSAAGIPAWCAPHLIAPGHVKHPSQTSSEATGSSTETGTTHTSHSGGRHSATASTDSTTTSTGQVSGTHSHGSNHSSLSGH